MPYADPAIRRQKQREATARWRAKCPEGAKKSEQSSNANRKNEQREWRDERRFRFASVNPFEKLGLFAVSLKQLQFPVFKIRRGGMIERVERWNELQKVMGCPL